MKEAQICYKKKDIIKVLEVLEILVVSLDRIGSHYSDCKSIEEYHALSSDFLDDWKILPKVANARKILSESFSGKLGDDDMDELERAFQELQYWSIKNPQPKKK